MNNIKKINFLLCLIFSFVFFFSNVFQVEAATYVNIYKDTVLEKRLDPEDPDSPVVACKFTYITVDNDEREVIWAVKDIKAWTKKESLHFSYPCTKTSYEISQDGSSAKIFVTIAKYEDVDWWILPVHRRDYDLTFELKVNSPVFIVNKACRFSGALLFFLSQTNFKM